MKCVIYERKKCTTLILMLGLLHRYLIRQLQERSSSEWQQSSWLDCEINNLAFHCLIFPFFCLLINKQKMVKSNSGVLNYQFDSPAKKHCYRSEEEHSFNCRIKYLWNKLNIKIKVLHRSRA